MSFGSFSGVFPPLPVSPGSAATHPAPCIVLPGVRSQHDLVTPGGAMDGNDSWRSFTPTGEHSAAVTRVSCSPPGGGSPSVPAASSKPSYPPPLQSGGSHQMKIPRRNCDSGSVDGHGGELNGACIREVWRYNLEVAINEMQDVFRTHKIVSAHTQFPGVIARPMTSIGDYNFQTVRFNVNMVKLLQLGITLTDKKGLLPAVTWQFNFMFDLREDVYSQSVVEWLSMKGIDFEKHAAYGVPEQTFTDIAVQSGVFSQQDVTWVLFNAAYDLAFLVKLLSARALPETEEQFFDVVEELFPRFVDLKVLLGVLPEALPAELRDHTNIGLYDVADLLQVERFERCGWAGPDSLVVAMICSSLLQHAVIPDIARAVSWTQGRISELGPSGEVPPEAPLAQLIPAPPSNTSRQRASSEAHVETTDDQKEQQLERHADQENAEESRPMDILEATTNVLARDSAGFDRPREASLFRALPRVPPRIPLPEPRLEPPSGLPPHRLTPGMSTAPTYPLPATKYEVDLHHQIDRGGPPPAAPVPMGSMYCPVQEGPYFGGHASPTSIDPNFMRSNVVGMHPARMVWQGIASHGLAPVGLSAQHPPRDVRSAPVATVPPRAAPFAPVPPREPMVPANREQNVPSKLAEAPPPTTRRPLRNEQGHLSGPGILRPPLPVTGVMRPTGDTSRPGVMSSGGREVSPKEFGAQNSGGRGGMPRNSRVNARQQVSQRTAGNGD